MATEQKTSNTLNIFLWIAQVLLAVTLLWAAYMKLFQPAEKLAEMWPWTEGNTGLVKFTGIVDLLGALGLILPSLLRIKPNLTVVTAYFILSLMIGASVFHIYRGEASQIGINVFFAALAIFVAWGRDKKAPVQGKGV